MPYEVLPGAKCDLVITSGPFGWGCVWCLFFSASLGQYRVWWTGDVDRSEGGEGDHVHSKLSGLGA